jgi:CDK inhibitor PHO81
MATGGHAVTISSVAGSYLYLVVQVTADLQPVIYPQWRLPEERYTLGVGDVSLEQLEDLAHRLGYSLDPEGTMPTVRDWRDRLDRSIVSLQRVLQVRLNMGYRSS